MVYFSAGLNYNNSTAKHSIIQESTDRVSTDFTNYEPGVSLAASYRKIKPNKRYYELMLTRFHFSKNEFGKETLIFENGQPTAIVTERGEIIKFIATGLRAEYGYFFDHPQFSRIALGIGGAINPEYYRFRREPATSASFPLKYNLYSIRLQVVPQINVKLSKNWSIMLKAAPTIFNQEFTQGFLENPRLTLEQQKTSQSSFKFLDNYVNFQLMVGYNIGTH